MASNALLTINHGIAAIGSMLAGIGSKDSDSNSGSVDEDIVNTQTLSDV